MTKQKLHKNESLSSSVSDHVDEWGNRAKNNPDISNSSVSNYKHSVLKFYRTSEFDHPIEPKNFNIKNDTPCGNPKIISRRLSTEITSRSQKYGVKKYLESLYTKKLSFRKRSMLRELIHQIDSMNYADKSISSSERIRNKEILKDICKEIENQNTELGLMSKTMYETASRAVGMKFLLWKDVWKPKYNGRNLSNQEIFIHKHRSKSSESRVVKVSSKLRKELEKNRRREKPRTRGLCFLPEDGQEITI